MIKPSFISLTKRNTAAYPKEVVLQGLEFDDWKEICHIPNIVLNDYETRVFRCSSKNFYSAFKLKQIRFSTSIKYLELDSFDIFGAMNDFPTCSRGQYYFHSFLFYLFVLT